jgi:chemotaxis protein CheC
MEQDALTEVVNVGVSRAAVNLSRIIAETVTLSVPSVAVLQREEAVALLPDEGAEPLVAVCERFQGRISGHALLIFPQANSLELVRASVGDRTPLNEISVLEQDAITEIGNVLLNGCLSVIANALRETLSISLPEFLRGDGRSILFAGRRPTGNEFLLFVQVDFSVQSRQIQGYLILTLNLSDLAELKLLLQQLVRSVTGGA